MCTSHGRECDSWGAHKLNKCWQIRFACSCRYHENWKNRNCVSCLGGEHGFEKQFFDANSYQGPSRIIILPLARHWLLFFENHKIDPLVARRNAQGRWGEIWGGLEICRFEICNYGLLLWIWHTSACHTARAADSKRYAQSDGTDSKHVCIDI